MEVGLNNKNPRTLLTFSYSRITGLTQAAEGPVGPCPVRHGGRERLLFQSLLLVLLLVYWAVGIGRSDPRWQFLCVPALWLLGFRNLASQECGQPSATSKHLALLRHAGSQVPPQLLQHLTELNGFKKLGCGNQDLLTELSYSVIFGEPCHKNLDINSLHKVFTDFKIRAS